MKRNLLKLFLLAAVLIVGAGEMWGGYYKIRVVCVNHLGEPITNHKVFVCERNEWVDNYASCYNASSSCIANKLTSDSTSGVYSSVVTATGNAWFHLFVRTEDQSAFQGWFWNSSLTDGLFGSKPNKKTDLYTNAATTRISQSETEEGAEVTTIYAKFDDRVLQTYYAKLHVTDADHRGAFKDKWASGGYLYVKDFTKNGTSYDENAVISLDNATVASKRGYRFVQWSVDGGSFNPGADITLYSIAVNITATSTNSAAPTTANLTGVFEELTADTIKITKDANRGVVRFIYQNKVENELGTGLDNKKDSVEMASSEETKKFAIYSTDEQTVLKAVPAEHYRFVGWYTFDEDGNKVLYSTELTINCANDVSSEYYAFFVRELTEQDRYVVGYVGCKTFEEALATAISSDNKVIRLRKNDTIPAGNYTIPADITLLIPYAESQQNPDIDVSRIAEEGIPTGAYDTLTLANGVNINVYGTIEVGGKQSTGNFDSGADVGIGRTAAPTYGYMLLKAGSKITLNNGSNFRAWGYVQGQGEIDARRGSKVFEQFQIMDWRGYDYTQRMFSNTVLPMTQYYIQNIESSTTYHPGAKLLACGGVKFHYPTGIVDVPVTGAIDSVGIIGAKYNEPSIKDDAAIFLMDNEDDSEDTWVRKYYDPATDRQVYEANNSAYLGSLKLKVRGMGHTFDVNSAEYVLPITNNFKIHLLTGEMIVTQHTVMLPGSEIEVNKKSTLTINAGQALSFYDTDQWDRYVCGHFINTTTYQFTYASRIKYRPGGVPGNEVRDISSAAALGNAKLTVHGSVNVEGQLFTTEGGASITSTKEDAGTILFTNAAPAFSTNHYVEQVSSTTPTYVRAQCVSALLTNEAGSIFGNFSQTAGTEAGKSYHFIDIDGDGSGEWVNLTEDECFVYDQSGIYYIKPQAYVPISSGKPEEEADHTYRDHYAGTNKIYIEVDCQWWEVTATATPGIFHCEHPDNNTYYYYDKDAGAWVEKKFNVVFKNYDGTVLTFKDKYNQTQDHYELPYNSHPQWLSDNPTRPANANYSYTFNGWNPAITAETRVTGETTFVAQYTEVPRQFIITFKNASGVEIETSIYSYLATPVAPTGEGINLETHQWSPAISAVTGNQVYQLIEKPGTFTVTYKDWDGTVLQTTDEITSGATTPSCDEPSRAADALYSYTFKKWSPAVAANVTADAVYTATYDRASKNFTVRFFKENGTSQIGEDIEVAYGVVPTPPTYSKATANHTVYTLVWSPLVAAATGDQDYIATFTEAPEQFTVTWKNGTETLAVDHVNYGVTPAYSGLTPTKEDADKIYTFTGWSPAIAAVTADQVYTAQFDEGHLKSVTVGTSDSYSTAGHVETLILKASESASGQITANVTATNAYFDLTINATTTLAAGATRQWHAFGVPWQVNLDTDPIQEVGGSNRTFVLGRDYDIIYYNGAKRAASGAGYWCWEFLENHLHLLQPGQGYMIAFAPSIGEVGTIRFAKKNLAPVIFNGTMTVDANTGTVANNSGWNAIANPKACKVTLNAGPTTGYVYNPATDNYSAFNIKNRDYIVGKVVYIQANATQSVAINNATGNPFVAAAPARRTEVADKEYLSLDDYYQVAIASTTTEGGHVYVLPEEGKENKYVIGHDLAQFGMSTAIPQIWVNRYDTKLALNTTALFNETAEFPMGVYAPNAGEYTISLNAQSSDEYNVYLTRDGQAIWNLSDGAFTADLKAGIQSNYGLRLTVNKAPQVVTGVDEAVVDAKGETKKVLINNQVFIIRGEKVYSIDGQLVK